MQNLCWSLLVAWITPVLYSVFFVLRIVSLWSTTCMYLQLLRGGGLSDHQFTVAVRLRLDQSLPSGSRLNQQSARTCGASSHIGDSDLELVKWNEMFFFRVDSPVSNKLILLQPIISSIMILRIRRYDQSGTRQSPLLVCNHGLLLYFCWSWELLVPNWPYCGWSTLCTYLIAPTLKMT